MDVFFHFAIVLYMLQMKKCFTLLFLGCIYAFSSFGQGNIPSQVEDALIIRYPHAEKVEWTNNPVNYNASYLLNGHQMLSSFTHKGDWLCTERLIKMEDLPQCIISSLTKGEYATWNKPVVKECRPSGEPIQYMILVEKRGNSKKQLVFNADGKLLKSVVTR